MIGGGGPGTAGGGVEAAAAAGEGVLAVWVAAIGGGTAGEAGVEAWTLALVLGDAVTSLVLHFLGTTNSRLHDLLL